VLYRCQCGTIVGAIYVSVLHSCRCCTGVSAVPLSVQYKCRCCTVSVLYRCRCCTGVSAVEVYSMDEDINKIRLARLEQSLKDINETVK
jgi:hypothetical protein